jgi:hypothetical protein
MFLDFDALQKIKSLLCIQQAKNIFLKLFTRSQIKLIFATRSNFRVYQFEDLLGQPFQI